MFGTYVDPFQCMAIGKFSLVKKPPFKVSVISRRIAPVPEDPYRARSINNLEQTTWNENKLTGTIISRASNRQV
jgi:hypothetical protein